MIHAKSIVVAAAALLCTDAKFCVSTLSAAQRPNILLILADDFGWSYYGGEIRTPWYGRIIIRPYARGGLRFSQFYHSARCSRTDAKFCVSTGLHPHQAGFPNLSGVLPAHGVTIPEVLRARQARERTGPDGMTRKGLA